MRKWRAILALIIPALRRRRVGIIDGYWHRIIPLDYSTEVLFGEDVETGHASIRIRDYR